MTPLHVRKSGLSHSFIRCLIESMPGIGDDFAGVYILDELPDFANKKSCWSCIVNLITRSESSSGMSGHFVAIIKKEDYYLYLDPYGLPAMHADTRRLLKNKPVFYNKKCIQSIRSTHCGLFCILFIARLHCGAKMDSSAYFFSENDNDNKNDSRCFNYLNAIIDRG